MQNGLHKKDSTLEETLVDAVSEASRVHRFSDINVIRATPRVSMNGADAISKLQLAECLQTTLDVESLLQRFDDCLTEQLAIDGVHYVNELHRIDIQIAHKADHDFACKLVTPDDLIGDLSVSRAMPFMEYEREIIKSFIDLLIYPLRNALHYREALTASLQDPLTGAGNRISLNNALQHEIEMTRRYRQDMAVLMLDMDEFKNINDMFGHAQGDEVLIRAVEIIQEDVRSSDEVYRFGGEEFVILLAATKLAEATQIAERLRAKIEGLTLEQDGVRIITTSSIGIAMLHASDSIESLLDRADSAMYSAKQSGRNRVIIAEHPSSE